MLVVAVCVFPHALSNLNYLRTKYMYIQYRILSIGFLLAVVIGIENWNLLLWTVIKDK